MRILRTAIGVVALIAIAVGLNFLVIRETLFTGPVVISLGIGVVAALLWALLHLALLAGAGTESAAAALKAIASSVFVLGICVMIYLFVRRADYSVDLTQEGRRDLAPQTIQVLESLTVPVDVTCIFIKSGEERIVTAQDKARRFLDQCREYTDALNVEFIDPIARPERVAELQILGLEKSLVGTVLLQSEGRRRELPLSDIHARLEERDFTNALINVAQANPPTVYFLAGHGGRDLRSPDPETGGQSLLVLLAREGYSTQELLVDPDSPSIPEDCAALVIMFTNGADGELRAHEIQALDDYIDDGGRVFIMTNVQYAPEGFAGREFMRPWLKNRFGINQNFDAAIRLQKEPTKVLLVPNFSLLGAFPNFEDKQEDFRGSFNQRHPITRLLDKTFYWNFIRTVTLDQNLPEGVTGWKLLRTAPDFWAETDIPSLLDGTPIQKDADEMTGPLTIAVAAARRAPDDPDGLTPEARIAVFGDADFTSNASLRLAGNQDLFLNSIAWLTEQEDLIAIRPMLKEQEPLVLTDREKRAVAWIASLGIVQVVILLGIFAALLRRRNA